MPDLVIKGMALPNMICGEPGYVDVRIFADGSVIMAKPAPPYYGKFEAVQLPKGHGKIVDAEEIRSRLSRKLTACKPGTIEELTFAVSIDIVDHADIFVPAEGGNADDSKP